MMMMNNQQQMMMNNQHQMMMNNPQQIMIISPAERAKFDQQFIAIGPRNGLITGDQAKALFMQSGLPPADLAAVWALADINRDGAMDALEFSIAMHLIHRRIQGNALPAVLPDSLKINPTITTAPLLVQQPMGTWPAGGAPPIAAVPVATKATNDWTLPHASKLRYSQLFNQLDKSRVGSLTGVHARNVLAQSQLPTTVLVHIWSLADVDRDGRLTVDEFCIAMHLIDMHKSGYTLPVRTPAELLAIIPRANTDLSSSTDINDDGQLPPQKSPSLKTFEDRRRDNYDRGQAELERRRQILAEQEKRLRDERERKEREEADRREKERAEAERRRLWEQEQAMARERELEAQRDEEQRRLHEQRESARKELERQRQAEIERVRISELTAARLHDQQLGCHAEQRHKNLRFQLQALDEKADDMNGQITRLRDQIVAITTDIEAMKSDRDQKLRVIDRSRSEIGLIQARLQQLSHERLQVQSDCNAANQHATAETLPQIVKALADRHQRVTELNRSIVQVNEQLAEKRQLFEERKSLLTANKKTNVDISVEYKRLATLLNKKQKEAKDLLNAAAKKPTTAGKTTPITPTSPGFGDNFGKNRPVIEQSQQQQQQILPSANMATWRYRALYEFSARSEDELSFQPGDIILVFKDHAAEPGWLAGQIRSAVGWFPEEYAECIEAVSGAAVTSPTHQQQQRVETPSSSTSPTSKPLDLIPEELADSVGPDLTASESQMDLRNNSTMPIGPPVYVIAQYPYKARKDTHLTFAKGDRIRIVEQQEMWWCGELNSKTGWFPKSYVKIVDETTTTTAAVVEQQSSPKKTVTAASIPNTRRPSTNSDHQLSTDGQWYVAIYPFAAPEPEDLKFDAGERIFVTQADGDWWTGEIGSRTGIFPATYVQKEEIPALSPSKENRTAAAMTKVNGEQSKQAPPPAVAAAAAAATPIVYEIGRVVAPFEGTAANQLTLVQGDLVRIRSKSPGGWWEGELQRAGHERSVGWFPGNYVEVISSGGAGVVPKSSSTESMNRQKQQPSQVIDANDQQVVAVYDYAPQQEDEMELRAGDTITIVEKLDDAWWRGMTTDGRHGLFPANYVQQQASRVVVDKQRRAPPTTRDTDDKKYQMHLQELIDTERNFVHDLCMVRDVFINGALASVLTAADVKVLFPGWNELIAVASQLLADLKRRRSNGVGRVLLESIDSMQTFVRFCERQQPAIDYLNEREAKDAHFRAIYHRCCQHEQAKGLPLSYFLLLPMGRVTKYPLMIEKLLKYSKPESNADYENLENSHQLLKALCAEVNRVLTEVESHQMIYWSQHHVRCDSIRPQLVFASSTNACGARKFLHSGILYKAKSNRLLIALLFTDMLMLTTPDDSIDVDSFKLSKHSDLMLTLYKLPILLQNASLELVPQNTGGGDESARLININNGETVISLKALNSNARILWNKQLERAIQFCQETVYFEQQRDNKPPPVGSSACIGRLLVELVCIRHLSLPIELNSPSSTTSTGIVYCKMSVDAERQRKSLDMTRKDSLHTTQFSIESTRSNFQLSIYIRRLYTPDVCAGQMNVSIGELAQSAGTHRGPILRQIPLVNSEIESDEKSFVIMKFVVQMFD